MSTRSFERATQGPTLGLDEYRRFQALSRSHFGVCLSEHKRPVIASRLLNHLARRGFASYAELIDHAESDPTGRAMEDLADVVLTNHTYFFRESAHFDFLASHVLPDVDRRLRDAGSNDLRVWCAAAATGEEAYSILITLREYYGARYSHMNAGVLATDVSKRVLEKAAAGRYAADQVEAVPAEYRRRYFRRAGADADGVEVRPEMRDDVLFRKFNLMTERYPFKMPFHVIFCRNVMIYFDAETRRRVIDKLYDFTAPGGYLFLGHAEAVDPSNRRYEYVRPAVYRKASR